MKTLRKICKSCRKVLGDVPFTTDEEYLKLCTSVLYCDDCGISQAIVEMFDKKCVPFRLTKEECDELDSKEVQKIKSEGTKYQRQFYNKSHPKPKVRKLATSQSSIDDFLKNNYMEEK